MQVRWTRGTTANLRQIERYIAKHDPAAAEAVFDHIITRTAQLAVMPGLGRPGRVPGTRELVIVGTPYLAIYSVIDEAVYVLRVLHGAQKWPVA